MERWRAKPDIIGTGINLVEVRKGVPIPPSAHIYILCPNGVRIVGVLKEEWDRKAEPIWGYKI